MATVTADAHETSADEPEGLYEVIDGKVVEKASMGSYEVEIACLLLTIMDAHARAHGLGKVFSEMLFRLDARTGLDRRPDVAFVSHERWPVERRVPRSAAWNVVPDLAIEVVSPTNRSRDDLAKIEDYFHADVRAVWVVYPNVEMVYVYASPTAVTILTRADALDGGTILPGFRFGLAELFGEPGE